MSVSIHKFITGPIETNTYIVRGDKDRCLVVDPSSGCEEVTGFVEREGLFPEAILLTHAHFDHTMGIPEFQSIYPGLEVYVHRAELMLLTNAGINGSVMMGKPFTYNGNTHDLTEGKMKIGSFETEVFFVPGHSPGGVAFKFDDFLLCGDILFAGSIGRSDFPGGDGELLIKGIKEKLLVLSEKTVVCPGHGGRTTIGREKRSNPYFTL